MSFFKTTIDRADKAFSEYIRLRDGKCVRCGWRDFSGGIKGLDASHYFSRKKEGTRFDPENVDALCRKCHLEWEHEKFDKKGNLREYGLWKLNQLGAKRYAMLEIRAATYKKKDRGMSLLVAKALLVGLHVNKSGIFGAKA